jgi:hypothetical protein
MTVGHFDICKEMARRGKDIRMSMLENVTDLRYSKRTKGTSVTIGVDGNIVGALGIENKFVGGLLLCDREQYFAIRTELEAGAVSQSTAEEEGK